MIPKWEKSLPFSIMFVYTLLAPVKCLMGLCLFVSFSTVKWHLVKLKQGMLHPCATDIKHNASSTFFAEKINRSSNKAKLSAASYPAHKPLCFSRHKMNDRYHWANFKKTSPKQKLQMACYSWNHWIYPFICHYFVGLCLIIWVELLFYC